MCELSCEEFRQRISRVAVMFTTWLTAAWTHRKSVSTWSSCSVCHAVSVSWSQQLRGGKDVIYINRFTSGTFSILPVDFSCLLKLLTIRGYSSANESMKRKRPGSKPAKEAQAF